MEANFLPPKTQNIQESSPLSALLKSHKDLKGKLKSEDGEEFDFSILIKNFFTKGIKKAQEEVEATPEKLLLDENIAPLKLEEATFLQLLQFLEHLNDGKKVDRFIKFNDKLKLLLKDSAILEEFKEAKSLKEIINLSKKYDLGLENLNITKKDLNSLKEIFPKLEEKGFFKDFTPQNQTIPSQNILSSKQEKNHKIEEKNEPKKDALSSILQNIDKKSNEKETEENIDKKTKTEQNTTSHDKMGVFLKIPSNPQEKVEQNNKIEQNHKNINEIKIHTKENENSFENFENENKSENDNQSTFAKDGIKTQENLKIKNSNLRQTINTFAQDFKEKLEEYKAPLMKVKMLLNPKSLGELDVTIINRGSNLHVSINSNTNAMNLFLQNQMEFKNALVNMGFTNLEMNFTNQRQNQQQSSKNKNGTAFALDEENNENDSTTLEIVVPDYI